MMNNERTTAEQKDMVGRAYISRVLGLGDEIAKRFQEIANHIALGGKCFMRDELSIFREVRLRHSAIPITTDTFNFWQEVKKILPKYTDHDVSLLSSAGIPVVLNFLSMLLPEPKRSESPVLHILIARAGK
jgi:hypothetical protein